MTYFPQTSGQFSKRVDAVSDLLFYIGEARAGSSETDFKWKISRITMTDDGDVEEVFANGASTFVNKWSERLNLSYY